jgi:hypothetical protein
MIVRVRDESQRSELLAHLREHGQIAYYVGEDAVEILALDPGDSARIEQLVEEWAAANPSSALLAADGDT